MQDGIRCSGTDVIPRGSSAEPGTLLAVLQLLAGGTELLGLERGHTGFVGARRPPRLELGIPGQGRHRWYTVLPGRRASAGGGRGRSESTLAHRSIAGRPPQLSGTAGAISTGGRGYGGA